MEPLNDLYREVILDHYQQPRGKGVLEAASVVADGKNPLCGDELTMYLAIDGDTIRRVSWQGHGCSICMASASMLAEQLDGITLANAHTLLRAFVGLMHGTPVPADIEIGDLEVLEGVKKFPVRIKCALLPWTTFQEGMREYEHGNRHATVSNE